MTSLRSLCSAAAAFAMLLILAFFSTPSQAQQPVGALATAAITAQSSDRSNSQTLVTVRVTNASMQSLAPPFWLELGAPVRPGPVTPTSPDGTTPSGNAYQNFSALVGRSGLPPGQFVDVVVRFNNPGRSQGQVKISFTPIVWANRTEILDVQGMATPTQGDAPLEVHFSALITGSPTQVQWDFEGDNVFDYSDPSSATTTHLYSLPGTYHPVLKVTGTTKEVRDTIDIVVREVVARFFTIALDIQPAEGVVPLHASLDAQVGGTGTPTLYEWDFEGDGTFDYSSASSSAVSHDYPDVGVFHPALRVSGNAPSATASGEVRVLDHLRVVATAQPNAGVAPLTVFLSAGSNAVLNIYEWDLDNDGSFEYQDLQSPVLEHEFPAAGSYPVRFRGTGVYEIATDDVVINVSPPVEPPPGAPVLDPHSLATQSPVVDISGSVAGASQVEVSGPSGVEAVPVTNDRFVASVHLHLNSMNNIVFTGITGSGLRGLATTTQVTNDTQAPFVYIDAPASGSALYAANVDVAGRVSDVLSGFNGLSVTVNGVAAVVDQGIGTNGTFLATGVPIAIGANTLTAVARDVLGNQSEIAVGVTRGVLQPDDARLEIASGGNQLGSVNSFLPEAVVIRALDGNGTPLPGRSLNCEVAKSNGLLSTDEPTATKRQLTLVTDADGLASVRWQLGSDAGCGNNRLRVSGLGIVGDLGVCASATPGPATQINIGSGNNQHVEVGAPALEPLRAWVSDGCNGASGIPVTCAVLNGGGTVNGATSVVIPSGQTGHAAVTFLLGPEPGNQRVTASIGDGIGQTATFQVIGVARNLNEPTRLDGLVFDNASRPIGGAKVTYLLGGQIAAETESNEQGQFHFTNIGAGQASVKINGLTATRLNGTVIPVGSFPALSFDLVVIPNALNTLPMPVLLPPLNAANAKAYSTTQDVELTCEGIEGLKMIVTAGSMYINGQPAPDGQIMSLNQVHHDDIPMPMPDGAAPPFAWTLQPGGAHFDPPIRIEYPNMSGLPPGTVANFLSFDHSIHQFAIVASGTVDEEGLLITTDAGGGLSVAGWGGNCPPYSITAGCRRGPDDGGCESIAAPGNELIKGSNAALGVGLLCQCEKGEIAAACPSILGLIPTCVTPTQDTPNGDPFTFCFLYPNCWNMYKESNKAIEQIGNMQLEDGPLGDPSNQPTYERYLKANALWHLTWQCMLTKQFDAHAAEALGYVHENFPVIQNLNPQPFPFTAGVPNDYFVDGNTDRLIDLHNNELGRRLAVMALTASDCFDEAKKLLENSSNLGPDKRPVWEPSDLDTDRNLLPKYTDRLQHLPAGCVPVGPISASNFPRDAEALPSNSVSTLHAPQMKTTSAAGVSSPLAVSPDTVFVSVAQSQQLSVILTRNGLPEDRTMAESGTIYYSDFGAAFSVSPDGLITGSNLGFSWLNVVVPDTASGNVYSDVILVIVGTALDTDADGIEDGLEAAVGLDPRNPGDGRADLDSDGLSNSHEVSLGTDMRKADTDSDGRSDGLEWSVYGTNPSVLDNVVSSAFTISVGGQVTTPTDNGEFSLSNISAPDNNQDQISDSPVGVTGSAMLGSQTWYLATDAFYLRSRETSEVPPILFGTSPPRIPQSISLQLSPQTLTSIGAIGQATVMASMNDGTTVDVTSLFTQYISSNPSIVRVDRDGSLTAVKLGHAYIRATNIGVTAVRRIDVIDGNENTTTITGLVILSDGQVVTGATVTELGSGRNTTTGADGRFTMEQVPVASEQVLMLRATFMQDGHRLTGTKSVGSVAGGTTDVGSIVLSPCGYVHWVGSEPLRGAASDLAVAGQYTFVAHTRGFDIIDVTNPSEPNNVAGVNLGTDNVAGAIAVSGAHVFVAYRELIPYQGTRYYMDVYNVENPRAPRFVGYVRIPGEASRIMISDQYAYVACGDAGLQILDVTSPDRPTIVGSIATLGAVDLAIAGGYAYIAQSTGLVIVDVNNPLMPFVVSSVDLAGKSLGVAVHDGYAYTFGDRYTNVDRSILQIIDVTDPASPLVVGSFLKDDLPRNQGVSVSSGNVYLLGSTGLYIVDVRLPASPSQIGLVTSRLLEGGLAFSSSGQFVYFTDSSDGLQIVDVSSLSFPTLVGQFEGNGGTNADDVAVFGGFAFLAGYGALQIVDVRKPQSPALTGTLTPERGNFSRVAVEGGYAYLTEVSASGGYLQIASVSNPMSPTRLGRALVGSTVTGVAVSGAYAYLTGIHSTSYSSGLFIVDVGNAFVPVVVASADLPGAGVEDLVISSEFAYVANGDEGLQIVDISDPSLPVLRGGVDTPGTARGVAVSNGFAYVADGEAGLQIIDVSDPNVPALVGHAQLPSSVYKVDVSDGFAYVVGDAGLQIVDVTNETMPALIASWGCDCGYNPGYSGIALADGLAFISWPDGLFVLRNDCVNQVLQTVSVLHTERGFPSAKAEVFPPRPNPSRGPVSIRYFIPGSEVVRMTVYNVSGRIVRTLVSEPATSGTYDALWDGRDETGDRVADGVYLFRIVIGRERYSRKVLLLR